MIEDDKMLSRSKLSARSGTEQDEDIAEFLLWKQQRQTAALQQSDAVIEVPQQSSSQIDSETLKYFKRLAEHQSQAFSEGDRRGHAYGKVTVTGGQVHLGNVYGRTDVLGHASMHIGDFSYYDFGSRLDRRVRRVQDDLRVQQGVIQNTLHLLIKEAGLELDKNVEATSLEIFIGQPENVLHIIEYLKADFWPFMRLMESMDACLQAVGSCIMKATDDTYESPGSWAGLIDGIKRHAARRSIGTTISLGRNAQSDSTGMHDATYEGQANENVRRILSNLSSADQRFKMLVLQAEGLTRPDGTSVTDEVASISSRGVEETESTSSFLSIRMRERRSSTHEVFAEALLDTGATLDCISGELAEKLNTTVYPDQRLFRSPVHHQDLHSKGYVEAILEWQDQSKIFRATTERRRRFYVVPGLVLPLILGHDFIQKYESTGIWNVCDVSDSVFEHVAAFGFGKISKLDRMSEEEKRQKKRQENEQKEKARADARDAQMADWFQRMNTPDDRQSQSTSTSQNPTSSSSGNTS